MFKRITIVISMVGLLTANAFAKDKVPREDFIKYTESCIDTTDELEEAFSVAGETAIGDLESLLQKLDLCRKKFNRYGKIDEWEKNSPQSNIFSTLSLAYLQYQANMWALRAGDAGPRIGSKDAKETTIKLKELFLKYKQSGLKNRKSNAT